MSLIVFCLTLTDYNHMYMCVQATIKEDDGDATIDSNSNSNQSREENPNVSNNSNSQGPTDFNDSFFGCQTPVSEHEVHTLNESIHWKLVDIQGIHIHVYNQLLVLIVVLFSP